MKKFKFTSLIMMAFVALFSCAFTTFAATSLPDAFTSDYISGRDHGLREVEYIKNFPVIMKTADNGKYYTYCMNLSATYAGNVKFTKTGTVDPGYIYILNTPVNTGDKDKDFYIKQMAVWYYEDYLSGKDYNLVREVKEYIVSNVSTDQVARYIYNLYRGAKTYKTPVGKISIKDNKVSFTMEDGYFVSNTIKVTKENLTGKIKYSLTNAPEGSLIVKAGEDGVKVKIPVDKVPAGKKLSFSLEVKSSYSKYTGYYYYNSNKYQKLLFQDPLETSVAVSDSLPMVVKHYEETYPIEISKTDVTQSEELPGATLVVKNSEGKQIDKWVSTTESHKIKLTSGEYTLTEVKAPEGYKLSKTVIYFLVDESGNLFVKNTKGKYVSAKKVVMINEPVDKEYPIEISKTDVTQSKELPGATLVVKNSDGKQIDKWVSTTESHKIKLTSGEYTLTEVKAPEGYKLSKTVIYFLVDDTGNLFVKNTKGKYVSAKKVVMINELIDVVSFAKRDSKTNSFVKDAVLVVKDESGNVIKEFITGESVYQLSLNAGKYTLSEVKAPEGYVLSNEVLKFELLSDGTLKVMNNKGEYVDSAIITFYNSPEYKTEIEVPATDKSSTVFIISGMALLIGGIACAKKTIKEC